MRKIIWLLILPLVLIACQQKHEDKNEGNDYKNDSLIVDTAQNPKIVEIQSVVSQLDSTDVTSVSTLTAKYTDIFRSESQGLCDSSFVYVQAYMEKVEQYLNDSIQKDTVDYSLLFEPNPPVVLKVFKNKLKANGFKFVNNAGSVYIEQDRNYIIEHFYPMLSNVMKEYLNQIKLENEQGFAFDEQITISPMRLVDRILWYDTFIAANPGFVYTANCKNFRKAYLTYLVCGYAKTVLLDETTQNLSPYFSEAYAYLLKKYPETETGKLLKPYIDALKQKQTEEMKSLRKTMVVKGYIFNLN